MSKLELDELLCQVDGLMFHDRAAAAFCKMVPRDLKFSSFPSSWAKVCCWHALNLACLLFHFYTFILSGLKSTFAAPVGVVNIAKLPHNLAIVIDSEDVQTHIYKIVQFLRRLAQIGVHHVSLYDMEGALKSSISTLADALNLEFGGDSTVHFYSHELVFPPKSVGESPTNCVRVHDTKQAHTPRQSNNSCHDAKAAYGFECRGLLTVEVLSLSDGKEAIVQAARHLCLKALQSDAVTNLNEEDIDTSLRETGGAGPDPDLLLLFSNTRCLLGFPAWRLRLTEILYLGSIRSMTEKSLVASLKEFSNKTHRYGK